VEVTAGGVDVTVCVLVTAGGVDVTVCVLVTGGGVEVLQECIVSQAFPKQQQQQQRILDIAIGFHCLLYSHSRCR
jgi:hypothetical protein